MSTSSLAVEPSIENLERPSENARVMCLDARALRKNPGALLVEQAFRQLLEQAAQDERSESRGLTPFVLAHPAQNFDAPEKITTRRRSGSVSGSIWERSFIKRIGVSAFHRFSPIDRLPMAFASRGLPTILTVLPPRGGFPFFISRRPNLHFAAPSEKDLRILKDMYHVSENQMTVIRPGIRNFVHSFVQEKFKDEGKVLFLVGSSRHIPDLKKKIHLASTLFPNLAQKVLSCETTARLEPENWLRMLQNTRVCFYFSAAPFDYATQALETIFCGIPTIFPDSSGALNELLPDSLLRSSHFMVEQPRLADLTSANRVAQEKLRSLGVFEPTNQLNQYRALYKKLGLSFF